MKAAFERKDFSDRLQHALRNADYSPDSPTQLAREFNVRFSGNPVTVHAARKWLVGEAIPTQEKLRALASWLGVQADWLRFGGENAPEKLIGDLAGTGQERFASDDIKLIADLQRLDDHYRLIAREIIRMLVRINRDEK
jgi:transcriptional regulator with XRE-family HTH domain